MLPRNLQLPQQRNRGDGKDQIRSDVDTGVGKSDNVLVHAYSPGRPFATDDFPPEIDGPACEESTEDGPETVDDDQDKVDFEELLHARGAEDAVALDGDGHFDEHEGEGIDPDCCPEGLLELVGVVPVLPCLG